MTKLKISTDLSLPLTLQKYVDYMASENRPLEFSEIVAITRVNCFRRLLARGLIVDTVKPYEADEEWTGPRFSKYVLTAEGKRYAP